VKSIEFSNIESIQYKCLETLSKLEKLDLYSFNCKTLFLVKIPNLKEVHIDTLVTFGSEETWENFTKNHPKLEIFILSSKYYFHNKKSHCVKLEVSCIVKSLKYLINLKDLSIHFQVEEMRFDQFLQQEVEDEVFIFLAIKKNYKDEFKITVSNFFANECAEDFLYIKELFPCDANDITYL
jgi:hypothetical protein